MRTKVNAPLVIEQLFFELIQIAIGNRKELRHIPSIKEWQELFDMAKKQALTAIAFMGVTKLTPVSDFGTSLGIPEEVYLKWLGLTAKVAQRNKELNAECAKVCAELAHDGLQCCVLKGQSNLVNYPEELRECRTAGDIDLWTLPANQTGIARVIEYAQQWRISHNQEPIPWNRILYYHVEMDTDSGTEVELHYRPSFLCSPLRNMRLQRWFKENEQFGVCDFAPEFTQRCQAPLCKNEEEIAQEATGVFRGLTECQSGPTKGSKSPLATVEGTPLCKFPIPTVNFNAVYQLLHIYKHLFEEGIGLRQLLDYYFVLRALHIEQGSLADRTESMAQWAEGMGIAVKSNEEIMHTLSRFGMRKFASATMYVLQTVFAMPDEYLICQPNEKEGKFLLNEIMQAGNFGKYDTRISHSTSQMGHAWEKLKHNFRLIRHYPEEVLWEPFFRLYHYLWRKFRLWRF